MQITSEYFRTILEKVDGIIDPGSVGIPDSVTQFIFKGDGNGIFHCRIGQGKIETLPGFHCRPDAVITSTLQTWVQLVLGHKRPVRSYLSGEVKVEGSIVLAQRMLKLFQSARPLAQDLIEDITGSVPCIPGAEISSRDSHTDTSQAPEK